LILEKRFGKRGLDIEKIRADILESLIWFQKNKKRSFSLILVSGMVARNIVACRQQEKAIGYQKLKQTNKGIKKLIGIIKNWVGKLSEFGNII